MTFAAVVVNPTTVPTDRLRSTIRRAEEQSGWEPSRWFETTPTDPGSGAARKALASGPDVLIVAGGDGTVRAVAAECHRTEVPLAIVPAGTGNLLARSLGLPLNDFGACVRAAFETPVRSIDIASVALERDTGAVLRTVFLAMAGVGLDAAMATKSDKRLKTLFGWMAYTPPIARSILANRSYRVQLHVDGRHRRTMPVHTMIVGNCGILTGDVVLIPNAEIDDGLLDLVILKPGRLVGWAPIGVRLALNGALRRRALRRPGGVTGRILHRVPSTPTTRYSQATRFAARFEEPQLIQLDGDAFDHVVAAQFEILPQSLRLRLPESAAAGAAADAAVHQR